jgi:hypothetical protein
MARLTLNVSTRDTTPLKAMEMVVSPMVIGTMVETRETTPMVTIMEAMVTTMEAMENIMEEMEITMEAMTINDCPENKQDHAANPNPFKKGYVNHINVEEVMGTFTLNSFTTLDFI